MPNWLFYGVAFIAVTAALGWKAAMAAVDEPFAFSVVIVFRRTANLLLIS